MAISSANYYTRHTAQMLAEKYGKDYAEKLKTRIPLRRMGTPDEVADAVAFLAKNEYANNCLLNLDGGLSAV